MLKNPVKPRHSALSRRLGAQADGMATPGSCRIMCSPFIRTKTPISSISLPPAGLSWSQLNRAAPEPQEPYFHTVIGGVALAFLCVAMSMI